MPIDSGLFGGHLIRAGVELQLLQLQLELIEQPLRAFRSRSEQLTLELGDLQPQIGDRAWSSEARAWEALGDNLAFLLRGPRSPTPAARDEINPCAASSPRMTALIAVGGLELAVHAHHV